MEIRVTTRDDTIYVVDPGDSGDPLTAFLEAAEEEWVRVNAPVTGPQSLFVRRSEIKLVAVVADDTRDDDHDAGADAAGQSDPTRSEPDHIF